MRKSLFVVTFLVTLLCSTLNIATVSAHGKNKNHGKHGDTFFPVVRVVLEPRFVCEGAAFTLLAEGGPKSYRFNGTLGFIACEQHRFKVGGEWLGQRLNFKRSNGRDSSDCGGNHRDGDSRFTRLHRWVHQWAVGGKYQYIFCDDCCCDWLNGFELGGYYSKADSKRLRKHTAHVCDTFSNFRRIAGSRSWGVEAGTTLDTLWNCGWLLLAVNYDSVEYERRRHQDHHHDHSHHNHDHHDISGSSSHHHRRHRKDVDGVGGTIGLHQPLFCDVILDFKYQYKRPYDYIEALLNWRNNLEIGNVDIGIFANHVWGKKRLPSSTTVGIELAFDFGVDNFFGGDCCYDSYQSDCCPNDCNDLALWVAEPAVYMPQVLAILEREKCPFPVGSIPTQSFPDETVGNTITIDLNEFISSPNGSHVRFIVSGLPQDASVNSRGIITIFVTDANINTTSLITVKATDECGTITRTFTLFIGSAG